MSIPASHIVAVSSRVLSGGSADLETNGLLLTKSSLIPAQTPAVTFTTASDVAAMFGAESVEAQFAQQYFTGCENQQMSPLAVVIARRVDVAAPAWIRSASLTVDLADLKKVTDGKLTLEDVARYAFNLGRALQNPQSVQGAAAAPGEGK